MHHVVRRHEHFLLFSFLAPAGQNPVEFLLGLLFLVAKGRGFFKILGLDRRFFLDPNVLDSFFDFLHIGRPRHRVDPRPRSGFIHDIDCLVRQEAARDVPLGKLDRHFERFVRQLRLMVRFVLRPQTFENQNCFLDRGRLDFDRLETTLQSRILFDVLAVLIQCGGADALQLTAA